MDFPALFAGHGLQREVVYEQHVDGAELRHHGLA